MSGEREEGGLGAMRGERGKSCAWSTAATPSCSMFPRPPCAAAFSRCADVLHVFIDGRLRASTLTWGTPLTTILSPQHFGGHNDPRYRTQCFPVRLAAGPHRLDVLSCALGLVGDEQHIGGANLADERRGLWGPVAWNRLALIARLPPLPPALSCCVVTAAPTPAPPSPSHGTVPTQLPAARASTPPPTAPLPQPLSPTAPPPAPSAGVNDAPQPQPTAIGCATPPPAPTASVTHARTPSITTPTTTPTTTPSATTTTPSSTAAATASATATSGCPNAGARPAAATTSPCTYPTPAAAATAPPPGALTLPTSTAVDAGATAAGISVHPLPSPSLSPPPFSASAPPTCCLAAALPPAAPGWLMLAGLHNEGDALATAAQGGSDVTTRPMADGFAWSEPPVMLATREAPRAHPTWWRARFVLPAPESLAMVRALPDDSAASDDGDGGASGENEGSSSAEIHNSGGGGSAYVPSRRASASWEAAIPSPPPPLSQASSSTDRGRSPVSPPFFARHSSPLPAPPPPGHGTASTSVVEARSSTGPRRRPHLAHRSSRPSVAAEGAPPPFDVEKCLGEPPASGWPPPLVVALGGLSKGMCWVNGHALGRYWLVPQRVIADIVVDDGRVVPVPPQAGGSEEGGGGTPSCASHLEPQVYYHVPGEWLNWGGSTGAGVAASAVNEIVLFDELGASPASVHLCACCTRWRRPHQRVYAKAIRP